MLFQDGQAMECNASQTIFRQGEQISYVYVILSGSVEQRGFSEDPVALSYRAPVIDNSARVEKLIFFFDDFCWDVFDKFCLKKFEKLKHNINSIKFTSTIPKFPQGK